MTVILFHYFAIITILCKSRRFFTNPSVSFADSSPKREPRIFSSDLGSMWASRPYGMCFYFTWLYDVIFTSYQSYFEINIITKNGRCDLSRNGRFISAIRLSFVFNICKHLHSFCVTSALINSGEPCVNNHQCEVKSDNSCTESKHICIVMLS